MHARLRSILLALAVFLTPVAVILPYVLLVTPNLTYQQGWYTAAQYFLLHWMLIGLPLISVLAYARATLRRYCVISDVVLRIFSIAIWTWVALGLSGSYSSQLYVDGAPGLQAPAEAITLITFGIWLLYRIDKIFRVFSATRVPPIHKTTAPRSPRV